MPSELGVDIPERRRRGSGASADWLLASAIGEDRRAVCSVRGTGRERGGEA